MMPRLGLALLVLSAALAQPARAESYPSRTVTIEVPFAAGGGSDLLARLVAQHLEEKLGKPFIVENRPGASTTLAAMQVVRATPDGTTLMQATSTTMAINVSMLKKMPYQPLKDLVPVALLSSSPFFLVVNKDSPFHSVADLIAAAKAKPNSLNYGSGGPGSMHHLSTELLQSLAGIEMTHVPYKGTPPAMNDLIAGNIQVLFGDTTSTLPFIQQGTVRALAVTTAKRSPAAPDVPTVAETVPGFESASWQMLVAPGGDAAGGHCTAQPDSARHLQRSGGDRRAGASRHRPGAHRQSGGGRRVRQERDRALERCGAPRRPRSHSQRPVTTIRRDAGTVDFLLHAP